LRQQKQLSKQFRCDEIRYAYVDDTTSLSLQSCNPQETLKQLPQNISHLRTNNKGLFNGSIEFKFD
jgi:hypothetical protein